MSNLKSLTTKEVARLCRVSDATVKRWEEAGVLHSERTNGGHRRFRAEEVARFQRDANLGTKQAHGDDTATRAANNCRRVKPSYSESSLFHTLVAGREEEAAEIMISAYLHGETLAEIFDGTIAPTMAQIGELWLDGKLSIAQEHLATRTIVVALQKLRAIVPVAESNGRLALCCGVEGDFHELPAQLIQIMLESAGWEVLNFGANTPFFALAGEVQQRAPELVCISATLLPDLDRAVRDYKELRATIKKTGGAVVLGGRVFGDEPMRRRFPAHLHANKFAQLSDLAGKISVKAN